MSTVGTLYDETVKFGYGKLLSYSVANNSASINCSLPTGFDSFWIDLASLTPTAGAYLFGRVSTDNGATWKTSNYHYGFLWGMATTGSGHQNITSIGGTSGQQLQLSYAVNPASTQYGLSGEILYDRGINGRQTIDSFTTSNESGSGAAWHHLLGSWWDAGTVTNILFYYGSGLIVNGTVTVYGLRKGT